MIFQRNIQRKLLLPLFLFFSFQLWAQQQAGLNTDQKISYIGMTLAELVEQFGTPLSVSAVRGEELWQDDVVFQYAEGDFYIYRDRVWQVKLSSIFNINIGERKPAVLLVLGDMAEDMEDFILFPVTDGNWPLMLRINFDGLQRASAIYLYRADY